MHLSNRYIFALLFLIAPLNVFAQMQGEKELTEAITKDWKKGEIQKRGSQFKVSVGSTGGNLVAYNVTVPNGDWVNRKTYINCDKFTGDDADKLNAANYDDGQFYELSGPFQFNYLDDTPSAEENKAPRFMIFAQSCKVKKMPDASISPDAREQVLRNNIYVLRVGPTFTCPDIRNCDPLAQIILTQKTRGFPIAELDVALVQAYQALRAFPSTDQTALRAESVKFSQYVKDFCRLPKRYTKEDAHGNLVIPNQDSGCVADEYRKQRHKWAARVIDMNNSDASEEVRRMANDHWFAQYLLLQKGLLPKPTTPEGALRPIDGSYGAGTRNAIKSLQQEAGLPISGFLSDKTFDYLRTNIVLPNQKNIGATNQSDNKVNENNFISTLQNNAAVKDRPKTSQFGKGKKLYYFAKEDEKYSYKECDFEEVIFSLNASAREIYPNFFKSDTDRIYCVYAIDKANNANENKHVILYFPDQSAMMGCKESADCNSDRVEIRIVPNGLLFSVLSNGATGQYYCLGGGNKITIGTCPTSVASNEEAMKSKDLMSAQEVAFDRPITYNGKQIFSFDKIIGSDAYEKCLQPDVAEALSSASRELFPSIFSAPDHEIYCAFKKGRYTPKFIIFGNRTIMNDCLLRGLCNQGHVEIGDYPGGTNFLAMKNGVMIQTMFCLRNSGKMEQGPCTPQ